MTLSEPTPMFEYACYEELRAAEHPGRLARGGSESRRAVGAHGETATRRVQVVFGALALAASVALAPSAGWSQPASPQDWEAPRTAWGAPDIGGVWNSSTVTPLERPEALADKAFLTAE